MLNSGPRLTIRQLDGRDWELGCALPHVLILLMLIVQDGLINVSNTFEKSEIYDDDKIDFHKVLAVFDNYLIEKKNIAYERLMFLEYRREEGQSIENFLTDLKL